MKKSLIAIAALGIISGSAFADTNETTVTVNAKVTSTCTFANVNQTLSKTVVAGSTNKIDVGVATLNNTCSLALPYQLYVDAADKDMSLDAAISGTEQLVVTAYEGNTFSGTKAPTAANADVDYGTGAQEVREISFSVQRKDDPTKMINNRHVTDSAAFLFTFEYTPE